MLLQMQSLQLRRNISCCVFIADILQNRITAKKLSDLVKIKHSAVATRSSYQLQICLSHAQRNYERHEILRRCGRLFNQVSQVYTDSNGSRELFRKRIGQEQQYISKLLSFEIY
jgi:hypothetical protein